MFASHSHFLPLTDSAKPRSRYLALKYFFWHVLFLSFSLSLRVPRPSVWLADSKNTLLTSKEVWNVHLLATMIGGDRPESYSIEKIMAHAKKNKSVSVAGRPASQISAFRTVHTPKHRPHISSPLVEYHCQQRAQKDNAVSASPCIAVVYNHHFVCWEVCRRLTSCCGHVGSRCGSDITAIIMPARITESRRVVGRWHFSPLASFCNKQANKTHHQQCYNLQIVISFIFRLRCLWYFNKQNTRNSNSTAANN